MQWMEVHQTQCYLVFFYCKILFLASYFKGGRPRSSDYFWMNGPQSTLILVQKDTVWRQILAFPYQYYLWTN